MPGTTPPDFGALLTPFINSVPASALPAFLARLERTAAERYRAWADQLPAHAAGLLECATREDGIAARIDAIYPATAPDEVAAMDAAIVPARDTYYEVFSGLTPSEQMTIQANAERQGAAAWRGMLDGETDPDRRAVLTQCALLEEASADYLDDLLAQLASH